MAAIESGGDAKDPLAYLMVTGALLKDIRLICCRLSLRTAGTAASLKVLKAPMTGHLVLLDLLRSLDETRTSELCGLKPVSKDYM